MPLLDLFWAIFWFALFLGTIWLIIAAARALIRIGRRRGGGWKAWAIAAGVVMVLALPIGLSMAGVIVLLDWSERRQLNLAEPTATPPPQDDLDQADMRDELAAEGRSAHHSGRYVGSRWVCDDHQTPWCPQCVRHHGEDRSSADVPQHANDASVSAQNRLPPSAA